MLFEQLLEEPALQAARSSRTNIPVFSVILYCVLKDLATIWSSENNHSQKALQLYVEAAQRDITDVALWRHTGTLVSLSDVCQQAPVIKQAHLAVYNNTCSAFLVTACALLTYPPMRT